MGNEREKKKLSTRTSKLESRRKVFRMRVKIPLATVLDLD
jgi:hypothetical protein